MGDAPPIGWIDVANTDVVAGWACDTDTPDAQIEVHLYFGGPAGSPNMIVGIPGIRADQASEDAVASACHGGGAHRFAWSLTPEFRQQLGNGEVSVYAYGINTTPGASNALLSGSPRTISAPSAGVASVSFPVGGERIAIDREPVQSYAYGPSIMQTEGQYHLWACGNGPGSVSDTILHATSADGMNWSPSEVVLTPDTFYSGTIGKGVMYACDPSVIRFTPPGRAEPWYYLYWGAFDYGPDPAHFQGFGGLIGVARSQRPEGPYAMFMGGDPASDASWIERPTTPPAFIRQPVVSCPSLTTNPDACYGAGQPTVVVRNGTLSMWYTDTTSSGALANRTLYATSTDGVNWGPGQMTNMPDTGSLDVKFDASTGSYFMIDYAPQLVANQVLRYFTSTDGLTWDAHAIIGGDSASGLPLYGHNPGISGDESGFLTGTTILGFGAPYPDAANPGHPGSDKGWGRWNLYSAPLTIRWL